MTSEPPVTPKTALRDAIPAALEVAAAAQAMNAEHGYVIFEDTDGSALAASVLAVLESNGFTVSHLSAASERED